MVDLIQGPKAINTFPLTIEIISDEVSDAQFPAYDRQALRGPYFGSYSGRRVPVFASGMVGNASLQPRDWRRVGCSYFFGNGNRSRLKDYQLEMGQPSFTISARTWYLGSSDGSNPHNNNSIRMG